MSITAFAKTIASSIIVPTLLAIAFNYVQYETLPNHLKSFITFINDFAWSPYFIALVFLPLCFAVPCYFLLLDKAHQYNIETYSSERIENYQESIHPKDIFIAIENQIMAARRYNKVPNRTYIQFNPTLESETHEKGTFAGFTIQETQPVYVPTEDTKIAKNIKIALSICGNLFKLLSHLGIIYATLLVTEALANQNFETLANDLTTTILASITCAILAKLVYNSSLLFWRELKFKSMLIYFKLDGTFTESKISTGMAYNDSTRSENVVVRSSLSSWCFVSNIVSSTFLGDSIDKLSNARYVMELHKNEEEITAIMTELKSYLQNREHIANILTEKNLKTASDFLTINAQSRTVDSNNIDPNGRITNTNLEQAIIYNQNDNGKNDWHNK